VTCGEKEDEQTDLSSSKDFEGFNGILSITPTIPSDTRAAAVVTVLDIDFFNMQDANDGKSVIDNTTTAPTPKIVNDNLYPTRFNSTDNSSMCIFGIDRTFHVDANVIAATCNDGVLEMNFVTKTIINISR
jgi:hypothetical protein